VRGECTIVKFLLIVRGDLNLEEIETPHTLGGYRRSQCRYYSAVSYTIVNRSLRICYRQGQKLRDLHTE
jgi:hypothetical protein